MSTPSEAWPTGAGLIAAERRRQVDVEGWSPEHDREHGHGQLLQAARAYEWEHAGDWPWDKKWWKPKGALRNHVRAGALYQAAADVANIDLARQYLINNRDRIAVEIDVLLAEVRDAVDAHEGDS